jgi:hypothetical protein
MYESILHWINHPLISSQFLNISEKMMKNTMVHRTSRMMFLFFISNSVLGRISIGIPCRSYPYSSRNDVRIQSAMAKEGPCKPPAAMPRKRSTLPASYAKLLPPHKAMLSSADKSQNDNEIQFLFSISLFLLMSFELKLLSIDRGPACQTCLKIFPVPEDLC